MHPLFLSYTMDMDFPGKTLCRDDGMKNMTLDLSATPTAPPLLPTQTHTYTPTDTQVPPTHTLTHMPTEVPPTDTPVPPPDTPTETPTDIAILWLNRKFPKFGITPGVIAITFIKDPQGIFTFDHLQNGYGYTPVCQRERLPYADFWQTPSPFRLVYGLRDE